jgi:hypothetical protein
MAVNGASLKLFYDWSLRRHDSRELSWRQGQRAVLSIPHAILCTQKSV